MWDKHKKYLENILCFHIAITHLVSTALLEEKSFVFFFSIAWKHWFLQDMAENFPEVSI